MEGWGGVTGYEGSSHESAPEVQELFERHKREGVVNFHVSLTPGSKATPEEVAAELNRIDRWLKVPENRLSSKLRGEAFILRDSGNCTLRRGTWNGEAFVAAPLEPVERYRAEREIRLAELLEEAAAMIEASAPIAGE